MIDGPKSGILWLSPESHAEAVSRFSDSERAKMEVEELKTFPLPPSSATVWKYFKPAYFKDFLESNELHLCQVSRFADEAEARMNQFQLLAMENQFGDNPDTIAAMRSFHEHTRERSWVTCFSVDEFESAHMWKTFCPQSGGIAIKTTFQKLLFAISKDTRLVREVYPALVRYENTTYMPWKIGYLLFQKLPGYNIEKELRLCICRPDAQIELDQCAIAGIRLPVTVRHLVQSIRVHPLASEAYFREVSNLVARHLPDKQAKVRWSVLRKG